jgi:hypothetical protein
LKPDLQYSVLCDDVRREDNGKLMLIGLFEMIGSHVYPFTYPGMAIVNRWNNGLGDHTQRIRIVDADNKALVETADSPVKLADMMAAVTAVSLLRNIQVPRPGRYWVEVMLDGDLKQRYPLIAVQVPAAPGPPGGPNEAPPRP